MKDALTENTLLNNAFFAKFRVYFEDTDAGGIVYYANYLKFCERARTEWLRSENISQQKMIEESHTGFVVYEIKGRYLHSAKLEDELTVYVIPVKLRKLSLTVYQEVYNQRGEKLFEFECTLACTNLLKNKPNVIDAKIAEFVKSRIPEDTSSFCVSK